MAGRKAAAAYRDVGRMVAEVLVFVFIIGAPGQSAWGNSVDDLAPGNWYKVPHSELVQVAPKPAPPGIVGPKAVVSAWSGGAFDTKRHRMIIWGGGHADYSGNEVYVFDVNTLKWQRLTEPSRNVGGDIKTGLYPDGRPRSAHSYNSLQYLPNIDRLAVFGLSATYRKSGGSDKLFTFNFNTLKWHHNRAHMPPGTGGYDAITAYDPGTGKVWVHGSRRGRLYAYDPVHDKWSQPYSRSYLGIYPTAAIDPSKNIMVAVGGGAYKPKSQALLWRLNDPGRPVDLAKQTNGPKEIEGAKAPGFVFDPQIGMFVGWDGGADVYVLNPDGWVWRRISPSAGNHVVPPHAAPNGTYGRFRYVPSKNAFILVNGATQDVYFYKLPRNLAAAAKRSSQAEARSRRNAEPTTARPAHVASSMTPINSAHAVTTFAVISEDKRAERDVPVTFGQVFRRGEVLPHETLRAKLPSGGYIPLQVDKKATNADGSLRFAVMTAIVPKLEARRVKSVELVKSRQADIKSSDQDPTLAALQKKKFDARIDIHWQGHHYSVSVAELLKHRKSKVWLSGPLVKEWVVRGPLKDADGREQPNLDAEFYVRAYRGLNHVRVGVAIDNDWSYAAAPRNLTYDITVSVGGKVVYRKTRLKQYAHSRWHGVFWWGRETPRRAVWLNTAYIQSTGAVPQYERLRPDAHVLNGLLSRWDPMEHGSLSKYMPATGANPDIGLLPRWAALYLVSGDLRAKRAVILNGEAGGTYSVHYQDKNTGLPLSIIQYPYVSIIGGPLSTINRKTGKSEALPRCAADCKNPYDADYAHMPSVAYLPYLITGDYYFLQELELWANWHEVWMNPPYRRFSEGVLFPHGQVRGQAWSLRELGYAAYIAPDNDPMKGYFKQLVQTNLDYLQKEYVDNPNANNLHFVSDWGAVVYNKRRGIAPWQQDFLNSVLDQLMRMGFAQARPVLKWFSKFPVGRMTAPGYCWISGAIYALNVRNAQHAPFYETFKQAYDNSVPERVRNAACNSSEMARVLHLQHVGEMTGYAYSPTGFPSNMQPALAAAVDVGAMGARKAWKVFMSRSVKPNYANYPNFAIIPGKMEH